MPTLRSQRGFLAAALLVVCPLTIVQAASASRGSVKVSAQTIVVSGHGFGHGIGLSQWGAQERALAGQSYREILAFYYPGTTLAAAPATTVRVRLDERARLRIGSDASFSVRGPAGRVVRLAAGSYAVGADGLGRLALPLAVEPGAAPLELGGVRYHGTLTIVASGRKVEAVNTLPLDEYVVDVVSSENPGYWRPSALEAQAVASRSYALASIKPHARFDLYPDNRSQNYHGMRKEFSSAAAAVSATRGEVLTYAGKPVKAYFSASNGGRTSGVEDVWHASPEPYLVSRADRFDAKSPDRSWGPVTLAMDRIRAAFPTLPTRVVQATVATNRAGRAATLTFLGVDGSQLQVGGYRFQQRLGLRSTYFSLTVCSTTAPV